MIRQTVHPITCHRFFSLPLLQTVSTGASSMALCNKLSGFASGYFCPISLHTIFKNTSQFVWMCKRSRTSCILVISTDTFHFILFFGQVGNFLSTLLAGRLLLQFWKSEMPQECITSRKNCVLYVKQRRTTWQRVISLKLKWMFIGQTQNNCTKIS